MRRLVVLRPEPGASATVARARELGLEAIAAPLFEIEPVTWRTPDPTDFDALLLTSANAVNQAGEGLEALSALPVHAVGEATAEAARRAGFTIESVGEGGVDQLLAAIDPKLRLLHLCGVDREAPGTAKQAIAAIPVYRSNPLPAPDVEAIGGSVALIHSSRAGHRLAELIGQRGEIAIAAISPAAVAAAGCGWQQVEAAEQPTDAALLALAARLCNKSPPQ
jgi:uroporphyrinogen-III synthase